LNLIIFNSKLVFREFTLYSSAPGKGLLMSSSPVSSIYRKHHHGLCCILNFANLTAMPWPLIFLSFLLPKSQLAKKETLRTTNQQEVGLKNPQSIFSRLNKQFSLGMYSVFVCSGQLLNQQHFQRQIFSSILKEQA